MGLGGGPGRLGATSRTDGYAQFEVGDESDGAGAWAPSSFRRFFSSFLFFFSSSFLRFSNE